MKTGTFYPDRYQGRKLSASSWFSANYPIDQPGRFLFGKFQEEAILLLATPMPEPCDC